MFCGSCRNRWQGGLLRHRQGLFLPGLRRLIPFHVSKQYNCFHLFFLPLKKFHIHYAAVCPQCASIYELGPRRVPRRRRKGGHHLPDGFGPHPPVKEESYAEKYRSTALAVSVITAMACLKYALFQGGELRPVSLAPQRAVLSNKTPGRSWCTRTIPFQLYFFPTENGPAPLAYVKRLGVWVQDYPGNRGVSPACTVNGTVYYFLACLRA